MGNHTRRCCAVCVVAMVVCSGILPGILFSGGVVSAQDGVDAGVSVSNQTAENGMSLVVDNVTLPTPGFITVHSASYVDGFESAQESLLTVSKRLSAGTHENVSIDLVSATPGSGGIKKNTTYALGLVADSNANGEFDASVSGTDTRVDTPLMSGESPIVEVVRVSVPPDPPAVIRFANQSTNGVSVRVDHVRLPDGGFVVIHNESYLPPRNDTLGSAVGISSYLAPGNHTDFDASLIAESVSSDQVLVAVPYRDTDGNHQFDYVTSDGFRDTAYEVASGNTSRVVAARAFVRVSGSAVRDTPVETRSTQSVSTSVSAFDSSGVTSTERGMVDGVNTSTAFRIRNLTVSRRSVYVDGDVVVTAHISNPTDGRLEDTLALESAGDVVATKDVSLFATETRQVRYEVSYDSPGEYIVRLGQNTRSIRVVKEGGDLSTAVSAGVNSSAGGGQTYGLLSWPVLVGVVIFVGVVVWAFRKSRGRQHPR